MDKFNFKSSQKIFTLVNKISPFASSILLPLRHIRNIIIAHHYVDKAIWYSLKSYIAINNSILHYFIVKLTDNEKLVELPHKIKIASYRNKVIAFDNALTVENRQLSISIDVYYMKSSAADKKLQSKLEREKTILTTIHSYTPISLLF